MSSFVQVSGSKSVDIQVPEYMAWDFIIHEDVLSSIRSKSKRKTLRKSSQSLQTHQIEQRILPIQTKDKFISLLHFFKETQIEKGNDFVLNESWFEVNTDRHRQLESLELWHGNDLVGLKMYSYDEHGFFLSHKATKREFDQLLNLGLILDFLSFERGYELGYSTINAGKGKNIFGVHVQLSLYEYKVSLGLHLRTAKNTSIQTLHFEEKNVSTPFVIYCILENGPKLLYVHPDEMVVEEKAIQALAPENLDLVSMRYTDFCSLQK